jgi:antitoxin (DNA-binding transcriptional repressor) of toxin-antitoxin stability system
MPIQDDKMQKTFVFLPDTATVAQALDKLEQSGGKQWWTLVITTSGGQIAATTFAELGELVDKYGSALFAARLADVQADLSAQTRATVEADSMDAHAAEALARRSSGGMVVVTAKGVPIGIISTMRAPISPGTYERPKPIKGPTRSGGGAPGVSFTGPQAEFASSTLVQLYGEYVKLSEDARATWKPNGKEPPTQPCGHQAWPELAADGKWVCSQCKKPI